eukprot:6192147-Pleurochrysis_carterae.AAC.2
MALVSTPRPGCQARCLFFTCDLNHATRWQQLLLYLESLFEHGSLHCPLVATMFSTPFFCSKGLVIRYCKKILPSSTELHFARSMAYATYEP